MNLNATKRPFGHFDVHVISRVHYPEGGKGNHLLPVAICFHIRRFVSRLGGKRAIFGYLWKNAPVQEDINPSIYLIKLTTLAYYKYLAFYRSIFFKSY